MFPLPFTKAQMHPSSLHSSSSFFIPNTVSYINTQSLGPLQWQCNKQMFDLFILWFVQIRVTS